MAQRLNIPAFGIAIGAVSGLAALLVTWLNWLTAIGDYAGWFSACVKALAWSVPGYGVGFLGGIWGGIVMFIYGLVWGALIALIYNRLATPVEEE